MSGVGILCFAASYVVALCLEISRIFFRSSVRNAFSLIWILAGLIAQTAYLYYHHAVSFVPIDGAESYFLVSAWGLAIVCFYLGCFHPKTPFGLVFLPIVLLLIGGALSVPENMTGTTTEMSIADNLTRRSTLWSRIHAGTFFLSTLAVCVGFVGGLMYLIQDRRLRLKRLPSERFRLPTIEWSQSLCRQAIGVSILLLGVCIFSGFLLRALDRDGKAFFSPTDPLVFGAILIFSFLLIFSGILSTKYFKTEGRYIALLTLIAFLCLMSMLAFAVIMQNAHWKRTERQEPGLSFLLPSPIGSGEDVDIEIRERIPAEVLA